MCGFSIHASIVVPCPTCLLWLKGNQLTLGQFSTCLCLGPWTFYFQSSHTLTVTCLWLTVCNSCILGLFQCPCTLMLQLWLQWPIMISAPFLPQSPPFLLSHIHLKVFESGSLCGKASLILCVSHATYCSWVTGITKSTRVPSLDYLSETCWIPINFLLMESKKNF